MRFCGGSYRWSNWPEIYSRIAKSNAVYHVGLRPVVISLVWVAFAWRVHGLDRQSLWRDEVDAIYFALRELPLTLSMFVEAGQNGALYFLALRPWLRLVGTSELALRYPSVLFGVLSVPLLWQVSRKLLPLREDSFGQAQPFSCSKRRRRFLLTIWRIPGNSPFLATAFLAINPYHIWYSQDGKMYALIVLQALLAAWFWLKANEQGGWLPWLGFLITVNVSMYTHLLMILLIPLFFVWFLIRWPQSKRHWKGYCLTTLGMTLPYLPLLRWQWGLLASNTKLTFIGFTPLTEILSKVLQYQSGSFLSPSNSILRLPIIGLGLCGFLAGQKVFERSPLRSVVGLTARRQHLTIVCWMLGPLLAVHLLSLRQPVFLPRYVIWTTPALMMLLALGTHACWESRGLLSRTFTVTMIAYLLVYWGVTAVSQQSQDIKTDLRSAVNYIYDRRRATDLLILQIPQNINAYQYYSSDHDSDPFENGAERLGWWAAGLAPVNAPVGQASLAWIDRQMHELTAGATDIWVLLSEVDLVDPEHLMVTWLDQNAALVNQVDFHGIQLRLYRAKYSLEEQ